MALTAVCSTRSLGQPKLPEEISGKARLLRPFSPPAPGICGSRKPALPPHPVPALPHRAYGVYQIFTGQASGSGEFCLPGPQCAQALEQRAMSGRSLNASVGPAAAGKSRVCGADNGVKLHFCNVVSDYFQRHGHAPSAFFIIINHMPNFSRTILVLQQNRPRAFSAPRAFPYRFIEFIYPSKRFSLPLPPAHPPVPRSCCPGYSSPPPA